MKVSKHLRGIASVFAGIPTPAERRSLRRLANHFEAEREAIEGERASDSPKADNSQGM